MVIKRCKGGKDRVMVGGTVQLGILEMAFATVEKVETGQLLVKLYCSVSWKWKSVL